MARKRTNKQKAAERRATVSAPKGTVRSRVAGVVTQGASKVKEVLVGGTANLSVAPGPYQQIFRYSQLAVGTAGEGRLIGDIWSTFIADVTLQGMPPEAVTRLESLGAESVLNADGFAKSISGSMGEESFKAVKESHRMAKAALKGLGAKGVTGLAALDRGWKATLTEFAKEAEFANPNGKLLLERLGKLDPKLVAKAGSNQVLSVVAQRGEDPFWIRQFNKVFKRQNSAVLPAKMTQMVKDASGGVLPKMNKEVMAAVAKAGLGNSLGRKAVGVLGKSALGAAGTALFLGLEAKRTIDTLGRGDRAKAQSFAGFQALGAGSSTEAMRGIVDQQEQVARRKVVMQQFEPELFTDVVRALASGGKQSGSLTSTERRIGSDSRMGIQQGGGRSADDNMFLLDELFNQIGQAGGQ